MNTRNTKIGMSLVLASMLSMGMTGCGGSSDSSPAAATGTDVTVERGKVYDANVTDSSTPAQVATQKSGKNIYTFASTPVYPVVVNGGWIDVNDDGVMDVNDTVLDIEMKSYTTTVTPVTTFVADANETIRTQKLEALVARLNVSGVGSDTNITVEDLLKVPSEAPRDVFVTANAIYKDIKENANALPDEDAVLTQFATIDTLPTDATAKDFEIQVVGDLVTNGNVEKVSNQDIFEFEQELPDAVVPELAQALLKNNIDMGDPHGGTFNADYTTDTLIGKTTWSVKGTVLTINGADGDRTEYTFDSETPTDGSSVSMVGFYGSDIGSTPFITTITVTAPVVVTPPTDTTIGSTGGTSLPDLNGYSNIVIYKNINQITADGFLSAFASNAGFDSSNTAASCTDFGFTVTPTEVSAAGTTTKTYIEVNTTTFTARSCTESDYTNVQFGGGSANILAYYGI